MDVSPRYQAPGRIAEFCKVRDGYTSRFPVSGARALELDHVSEYRDAGRGGPTTAANLACTGKRDHQAKTDRLIDVTGDANSELVYRTGAGHRFRSLPHRYLDPGPDPPPP